MVILGTKVEVAKEDGGFRAGNDEDDEHDEKESIHVIDLAAPDAVQDEEELDKNAAKWEHSTHDDAGDRLGINALVRNLPGDLVGPHGLLDAGLPEAKVGTYEGERHGDTKPEGEEGDKSEERNGSTTAIVPEHKVEDEEVGEDDPGAEHGGEQDI